MHLYKIFSTRRSISQTAIVKIRIGSPKRLGMNKFVRTKSHTGSKFSKIFFEPLYAGWTVVVHICCGFLYGVRWRHKRAPNLEPRFGQFRTSLRKDGVANFASIWTLFSTSITGRDILCNTLNSSQIRL